MVLWCLVSGAGQSITYQELFPVVIAADFWAKKHVFFRSDNEAVVAILTTRISKVPALMHFRDLLSAACWGF